MTKFSGQESFRLTGFSGSDAAVQNQPMPDTELTPEEIARNHRAMRHVKSWLRYREMSQRQIAERMEVSEPTVSKWLAGKQGITMGQFSQLAMILKCQLEDLLFPPEQEGRGGRMSRLARVVDKLPDDAIDALITAAEKMSPKDPS